MQGMNQPAVFRHGNKLCGRYLAQHWVTPAQQRFCTGQCSRAGQLEFGLKHQLQALLPQPFAQGAVQRGVLVQAHLQLGLKKRRLVAPQGAGMAHGRFGGGGQTSGVTGVLWVAGHANMGRGSQWLPGQVERCCQLVHHAAGQLLRLGGGVLSEQGQHACFACARQQAAIGQ